MLRTDRAVDGAKVHYQSIEIAGGNPRSIERREGLIVMISLPQRQDGCPAFSTCDKTVPIDSEEDDSSWLLRQTDVKSLLPSQSESIRSGAK